MLKFVVMPDSFKGTLSSNRICEIICERLLYHFADAELISVPVADGGEGSVSCFLEALGGTRVVCTCKNPYFEEMEGFYGLIHGGRTAVIEMAACAGLPLVEERKNPLKTTTYGVGELILDALKRGAKEIVLGLGGSATNDFGCGAAAALGINFFKEPGEKFIPVGGTMCEVSRIETVNLNPLLKDVKITLMCDVKNSVFGENGAAYVYAPQKGAAKADVEILDAGLRHICRIVKRDVGMDVALLQGGGAAGAMAAGMVSFLNAEIKMGIDTVLSVVNFDEILEGATAVFTGEGKLDSQSLQGKVVCGVAKRAKEKGVPVIAIVGGVEGDVSAIYQMGVNSIFTINRLPEDFSVSRFKSEENLRQTADNVIRLMKL